MATEPLAEGPSGKARSLNVPQFLIQSFNLIAQERDVNLICGGPGLAADETGAMGLTYVPRVLLSIPAVEAKELMVLLKDYVDGVESKSGELTSDFLRERSKAE